jgi:hypothetical protein
MTTLKFILRLISDAYYEWSHDRAARLGAALAYYALFSFAPLLVIMITIAGSVYGENQQPRDRSYAPSQVRSDLTPRMQLSSYWLTSMKRVQVHLQHSSALFSWCSVQRIYLVNFEMH